MVYNYKGFQVQLLSMSVVVWKKGFKRYYKNKMNAMKAIDLLVK